MTVSKRTQGGGLLRESLEPPADLRVDEGAWPGATLEAVHLPVASRSRSDPMAAGLSPSDASFASFPRAHERPWVSANSRKGGSLCRLAGVHQAAWPEASGPMDRSSCRLARSHEARGVSGIAGRGPPSCHLAASFSPYGCPPRPEGCILLGIADTDHACSVHPSPHTGVPLRGR